MRAPIADNFDFGCAATVPVNQKARRRIPNYNAISKGLVAASEGFFQRARVEDKLLRQNFFSEAVGGFARLNGHTLLIDDGAAIDFGGDPMHRRAALVITRLNRAAMGVKPLIFG